MKYAILAARLLMGIIFLVFGANHIVPFLHMPAIPGDAGVFATILFTHKYFAVIGLIEVIGGLLLLVGRFVPFALTILGPVIVNIFLFTALIAAGNLVLPVLMVVLEIFLIFAYRLSFAGIFSPGPEVIGSPKL
jgi:putative oxidoreductase